MHVNGIVAEYNPFHNGHLYHLEQSRKFSGINRTICVMSGNFTQRGDAAILDKWARAAIAVQAGVDLVIELPVVFAVRSAQNFALGALRLLDSLGIVKTLCFGAEHANYALLNEAAQISVSAEFKESLRKNLKLGQSYAAALSAALTESNSIPLHILSAPNNILGIEYLKAIQQNSSKIQPIILQRNMANHHDEQISSSIASATAIRNQLKNPLLDFSLLEKVIPACSYQAISSIYTNQSSFPDMHHLNTAILTILRTIKINELSQITGISEGLEYKFLDAALKSKTMYELLVRTKSKRYPLSRLQRILIHCLLGTNKKAIENFDQTGPLYARVLAFNTCGRTMLKELKSTSSIPIITKITDYLNTATRNRDAQTSLKKMLAIDTYATDIYSLCFAENRQGALDFTHSPIYIK